MRSTQTTLNNQETARLAVGGKGKVFQAEGTAYSKLRERERECKCIQFKVVQSCWSGQQGKRSCKRWLWKGRQGPGHEELKVSVKDSILSKGLTSVKCWERDYMPTLPPRTLANAGFLAKHLLLVPINGAFPLPKVSLNLVSTHPWECVFPVTQPWCRPWGCNVKEGTWHCPPATIPLKGKAFT